MCLSSLSLSRARAVSGSVSLSPSIALAFSPCLSEHTFEGLAFDLGHRVEGALDKRLDIVRLLEDGDLLPQARRAGLLVLEGLDRDLEVGGTEGGGSEGDEEGTQGAGKSERQWRSLCRADGRRQRRRGTQVLDELCVCVCVCVCIYGW